MMVHEKMAITIRQLCIYYDWNVYLKIRLLGILNDGASISIYS